MRYRRLIGPSVILLVIFGLLADHFFMGESPVSVTRLLGKVFGILAAILSPAIDPALYSWIDEIFLPLLLVGLAIMLLSLSVSRAKQAMSQATQDVEASAPEPARKAPVQIDLSVQKLTTPPGHTLGNTLLSGWAYSFGMVGLIFGLVVCIVVFSFLGLAIERQSKNHVAVMTMGVGEIVAPAVRAGNIDAAAGAIERFAATYSVAYLYLEDANGRIIAHWPRELLRYLRRDFPNSTERALRGVDSEYQGVDTYEVARRMGDGKLGFVHLAVRRQAINAETYRVTAVVAAMILIVVICIIGLFLLLSRSLLRPLADLVDQAARLSKGDFDVGLELQRSDEFGDIARSLERLRSSLRAVTTRLDKRQLAQRSGELNKAPRSTR